MLYLDIVVLASLLYFVYIITIIIASYSPSSYL